MEERKKKISELQSDLLELRDAHAKLRTANEKLRRDRDRFERDRDSTSKRRLEQVGEKKVGALLQTVDELVKIAPELQNLSSREPLNVSYFFLKDLHNSNLIIFFAVSIHSKSPT